MKNKQRAAAILSLADLFYLKGTNSERIYRRINTAIIKIKALVGTADESFSTESLLCVFVLHVKELVNTSKCLQFPVCNVCRDRVTFRGIVGFAGCGVGVGADIKTSGS